MDNLSRKERIRRISDRIATMSERYLILVDGFIVGLGQSREDLRPTSAKPTLHLIIDNTKGDSAHG